MWLIKFNLDGKSYYLQRNVKGIPDVNFYFSRDISNICGLSSMVTINGLLKRFKNSQIKSIYFGVNDDTTSQKFQGYTLPEYSLEVLPRDYDLIVSKFLFVNTKKDVIFFDGPFMRSNFNFGNVHCIYTMCYRCGMLLEGDTRISKHTDKNVYGDFCPLCKKCKSCCEKISKHEPEFEKEWLIRKLKMEG